MSSLSTPSLLDLAAKSLLRNEAMAIAALELLPVELFPPMLKAAVTGECRETLQAMVQAWPLALLPLGALMTEQQSYQDILWAALRGLEDLLAKKVRPRRWKLQMLDLRAGAHQEFWIVWAGSPARGSENSESEVEPPKAKRQKVEVAGMVERAPVEVLMDLCLNSTAPDEFLTALLKKVRQRHGQLRLCCKKLQVFSVPMQNIKKVLKTVQLHSVQNLEMNCTWKLSTLGRFARFLGQMVNLRRFLLCHLQVLPSHRSRAKEEQYICQFAAPFSGLCHLRELRLDSISFLEGRLHHLLRCLTTHLEILSITNCLLEESDLIYLSQCHYTSQLRDLSLSGVSLTTMNIGPLRILLEHTSATLRDLDLDECGIMDAQFSSILPALGRCARLETFSFCGNPISIAVLESLLRHTAGLAHLNHMLYAAPLESYEEDHGTLHLGRLAQLHTRLTRIMQEVGRSGIVWFSANLCPQCGDRTFYDPNPVLCPCYTPA
ncbi:PREDICTED: melanoma antigen preferentially expressed in tumors [Chrysochloris asiatica]|uniref:Melanoma antigen preferentially expressed in tumors n=1 Tax=Chrysochloris asiatica TaxID=185453 RepID=A0A9B0U7L3_CHRAS|nr:PREDICTED: melanoma antigen preferentially expressed in tumors [Chrysochloris asiatica]